MGRVKVESRAQEFDLRQWEYEFEKRICAERDEERDSRSFTNFSHPRTRNITLDNRPQEGHQYCDRRGFGDLRKPNVMITKNWKVQLNDFDWARGEGDVTYPVSISHSIEWPKGVKALELMFRQHDLDMLEDCQEMVDVFSLAGDKRDLKSVR